MTSLTARAVAMTVVAQAVNDLPTIKRPAGANVATTGRLCGYGRWPLPRVMAASSSRRDAWALGRPFTACTEGAVNGTGWWPMRLVACIETVATPGR